MNSTQTNHQTHLHQPPHLTSGSEPNPETQTNLNIPIMPESIVEEVLTLFPDDTNIAYDIRPLSSLPQHPETQQPTLELIIPSRPTILTYLEPLLLLHQVQR